MLLPFYVVKLLIIYSAILNANPQNTSPEFVIPSMTNEITPLVLANIPPLYVGTFPPNEPFNTEVLLTLIVYVNEPAVVLAPA